MAIGALIATAATVVAIAAGGTGQEAGLQAAASELSHRQLAGQRLIASFDGTKPPKRLIEMVRAGQVAGVIFFEENVANRDQLAATARRLERANRRSSLPDSLRAPLLLMVDQEGGAVRRLPGPPSKSQAEIGRSSHARAAARKAGRGAGRNLRRAGVNVNLAPVLDVAGRDSAIAAEGRAYADDPGKVGRLGAAFIEAIRGQGVAATAKHFPGLGRASVNTDAGAVRIKARRERLRDLDEAPFAEAIESGVELMMLSNAVYTAIDRRRPAGLSRRVIESELRDHLDFDGVTITDALEASGLSGYGGVGQRGLRAAKAGADLLLFGGRRAGHAKAAFKRLARALRRGTLDRDAAVDSATRVLELRARLAG